MKYSKQRVPGNIPARDVHSEEIPLRAELLDSSRIREYAEGLAREHKPVPGHNINTIKKRLARNEKKLLDIHELLNAHTGPAVSQINLQEWNNSFYVILSQISKIRDQLKKVDNELPVLQDDNVNDYPRIYTLMLNFVSHTNAQVDFVNLVDFISAYQRGSILQVGELKSMRSMIKMALLENVCRLADRLTSTKIGQQLADNWSDDPDRQELAKDRISLRNSISSLRLLDTIDWQAFSDITSNIEVVLAKERSGIYPAMDHHTRDRYRDEVGIIAKQTGATETEVAERAVRLADTAVPNENSNAGITHVGYYLIGAGRKWLQQSLGARVSSRTYVRELAGRLKVHSYIAGIVLLSFLLAVMFLTRMFDRGLSTGLLIAIGILLLLNTSQIAKLIVDSFVGFVTKPELLPRLDFSKGIPVESSTLVAIPAIISTESEIEELVHTLEVRFLANKSDHLYFGLVTDFKDSVSETLPEHEALLDKMVTMIRELNKRYPGKEHNPFFLFHRPLKWNALERVWMGHERKRGKLMGLNALLRGSGADKFSHIEGDITILRQIKYVITLDSDTQLPRDAAWKMAGVMAHVLNRPVYSDEKKRVIAGYGILQPRVKPGFLEGDGTDYQQWSNPDPDIDPYTRASPDLYQDIFGEGSFIGKGIYDVDIAIKVLGNAFPDNRILSHDLLEGCYLRSGLLNDVTLYEQSPTYITEAKRRHRWTRGDWQIAAWVGPLIPDSNGDKKKWNRLSLLSRWKIFDNLRISFLPIARMLLFIVGLLVQDGLYFSLVLFSLILFQTPLSFFVKLLRKPKTLLSWQQFKTAVKDTANGFKLNLYEVICLPYEAVYNVDAIVRAHWRMLVSHRKLLEWVPSHQHKMTMDLRGIWRMMWPASVLAMLPAIYLLIVDPVLLLVLSPILLLWICAPVIVWKINKPIPEKPLNLSGPQIDFLQKLSRRTWAYFDTHVGRNVNWLPPDHYQEYRESKLANYTSPTNIGLALLSDLAASDFGYITRGRFIERISNTMKTMERLERFKGHFYNWYNIQTLQPSHPRYVSTVDSGNLAGHLLVLRQALRTIAGEKMLGRELFCGMRDALHVLHEELNAISFNYDRPAPTPADDEILTPATIRDYVESILAYTYKLSIQPEVNAGVETAYWLSAIERQCNDINSELELMAPWLWLPPVPVKFKSLIPQSVPTLQELKEMQMPDETAGSPALTMAEKEWLDEYKKCIRKSRRIANDRILILDRMVQQCSDFTDMEYEFLYNRSEQLLSIGYHVDATSADVGYYDVLSSEARLAFYVSICQGKLPVKSWFALGRTLVAHDDALVMLSANGTMFEYLMPLLVMPTYPKTLLDQACKAAVLHQMKYGKEHSLPWGISESAYSTTDQDLNYQYKVFGVPELSLKHTHSGDDMVIAPYASALALMINPEEAYHNLKQLSVENTTGRYGFYESIDYTPSRRSPKHRGTVVRSFMVHHQGMSFLSLAYQLLHKPMQKRFLADAELTSSLLLLQEQIPKDAALHMPKTAGKAAKEELTHTEAGGIPAMALPVSKALGVQLLSNGKYQLMITSGGNSFSHWENIAINKWRRKESAGVFCFIRDIAERKTWSTTYEPLRKNPENYTSAFPAGSAVFNCSQKDFESRTQVITLPYDNIEMRQITIHNRSGRQKTIEVTGKTEVLLAPIHPVETDPVHGTSFYQTEVDCDRHAILYGMQANETQDRLPCMFLNMSVDCKNVGAVFYETDGNDITAFDASHDQPGTAIAIKYKITIDPGETATVKLCMGIEESRPSCIDLLDKCRDFAITDTLLTEARNYNLSILKRVNASVNDLQLFQRLAEAIVFSNPEDHGDVHALNTNSPLQQSTILLRVNNSDQIEVVEKIVQMHAYWRLKGLTATIIIWNECTGCYKNFLQRLIMELITNGVGSESLDRPDGIFLESIDKISDKDRAVLRKAAYVIKAEKWNALSSRTESTRYGIQPFEKTLSPNDILQPGEISLSNSI